MDCNGVLQRLTEVETRKCNRLQRHIDALKIDLDTIFDFIKEATMSGVARSYKGMHRYMYVCLYV